MQGLSCHRVIEELTFRHTTQQEGAAMLFQQEYNHCILCLKGESVDYLKLSSVDGLWPLNIGPTADLAAISLLLKTHIFSTSNMVIV